MDLGNPNLVRSKTGKRDACFSIPVCFIWAPISLSSVTWYISLLILAFAQPITALDIGLAIVIRIIYFPKDEFYLEQFIQWFRLSCIRARQVFLFQLSVSWRFIRLYSQHFPWVYFILLASWWAAVKAERAVNVMSHSWIPWVYILKRKLNVFQALIISLYFPKPLAVSIAEQKLGKSKKTENCKRGNQGNIDQKLCCSFFGPVINYPRLPTSLFPLLSPC